MDSSTDKPTTFKFDFTAENSIPITAEVFGISGTLDVQVQDDSGAVEVQPVAREPFSEEEVDSISLMEGLELLKGRISSAQAAESLGRSEVEENDLIPGSYEGGFKLWEGGIDLARYLCKKWKLGPTLLSSPTDPAPEHVGEKVLELGCGHGLPGIVAMLAGCDVHFQDYNKEVLTQLTAHNVRANAARLPVQRRPVRARYFSGDWKALGQLMASTGHGGAYDVILTAETLYSPESHLSLYECIKQCIKPPSGVAYIASKSFYFGVGGGTTAFKKLVKSDGIFEIKTVASFTDGASTKREVLELKFPASIAPYFL